MRPGDHPEFFRLPAPGGASRESSIVLDEQGRFFHDGAPVEHPGMARAFSTWIDRHPDDGRFILNNGYDWTYFEVKDAPFLVVAIHGAQGGASRVELELSDATREPLRPELLELGENDALYQPVKGGRFLSRFSRPAQLSLAPLLGQAQNGAIFLELGGRRFDLPGPSHGP